MATPRQIEANRRNAQRSTGPRTENGKSVSRMNALKSGMHARSLVIFDESSADLEVLIAEYYDRWQPATPEERALVDTLINAEWVLRRLRRIEPELWETIFRNYDRHSPAFKETNTPLAFIYTGIHKDLDRLQTRLNGFDRTYHRALVDLLRLQKERRSAESPKAQPEPPKVPALAAKPQLRPARSEIGFISIANRYHFYFQ
jgi:hypothetical protein